MINFLTSLQPILTDLQACSSLPSNIHRLTLCHRQLLHQHIEKEEGNGMEEDTWFLDEYYDLINYSTTFLPPIFTDLQAYSSLPPNIHGLTQCHRQLLHQHIERELVYDKKEDTWFLSKYCSLKMSSFYFSVTITPLPSGTQVFPIQHPPLVPMSQTVNPSSH